jgi:cell wall-associated NlpC family hydrolase
LDVGGDLFADEHFVDGERGFFAFADGVDHFLAAVRAVAAGEDFRETGGAGERIDFDAALGVDREGGEEFFEEVVLFELADREEVAKAAFDEAQAAAEAVQRKVAENEELNRTMIAQLADLNDTAEDLERQRQEGLEAERRQNAVGDAPTAPELYTVGNPNGTLVEKAIDFAKAQLGERYVLGGAGPDVWDCSGITMKSYAAAGVYIGWHSATAQFNVLASQRKLVPFQDAKRGDLIWWTRSSNFSGDKYHVAIYLGDGMMLEAPNPARTVRVVPVRYGELFPYAGRPTASGN